MKDKLCRVLFHNAPDCEHWRENIWAADLGVVDGKRYVALRNTPVGQMVGDPKSPHWGDTIEVDGGPGAYRYDIQSGVIVERYVPTADDMEPQ